MSIFRQIQSKTVCASTGASANANASTGAGMVLPPSRPQDSAIMPQSLRLESGEECLAISAVGLRAGGENEAQGQNPSPRRYPVHQTGCLLYTSRCV